LRELKSPRPLKKGGESKFASGKDTGVGRGRIDPFQKKDTTGGKKTLLGRGVKLV